MSGSMSMRLARAADVPEIVSMLESSLGPAMTPQLWRWKHLENPFGPSPVLLALDRSGIAAVRPFMRWQWSSGREAVSAVRAVDTATRPDLRRRGLFSELTRELLVRLREQGVAFVYNTPNRHSLPGYLRLGWSRVARVPLWVAPHPLRMARRVLPTLSNHPEPAKLPETARPVARLLGEPDLESLLDGLATRREPRYSTVPTPAFLQWRYARPPHVTYGASWDLRGGRGGALIFRRRLRGRFREISVSEILASDRDAAAERTAPLLRALRRLGDADYLVAVAPGRSLAAVALRRAGFVYTPGIGPQLVARLICPNSRHPDPLRWRSWCCSLGDLEIF